MTGTGFGEGGKRAILFIHGILGTPNYFRPFWPLVPSDWPVCNLLLAGHGGSVRDISAASMRQWQRQVHEKIRSLSAAYGPLVITAHSMGTLFAIQEAISEPENAASLFLLNVPLRIGIKFRLFPTMGKVFSGRIQADDQWGRAAQKAYGVAPDTHYLRYLGWLPRYLELFREMGRVRRLLPQLNTPSRVYLSAKDEMVSSRSAGYFRQNPCVTLKMLPASGHCYYVGEDLSLLLTDFQAMVQEQQAQLGSE